MHKVQLKYGRGQVSLQFLIIITWGHWCPRIGANLAMKKAIIAEAMNHPIGTQRLRDIVQPDNKVVIVTSDITRPLPTDRESCLLFLKELKAEGRNPTLQSSSPWEAIDPIQKKKKCEIGGSGHIPQRCFPLGQQHGGLR